MNGRDFKALLDVLERIAVVLEEKKEPNLGEHMSVIRRKIDFILNKPWSTGEYEDLLDCVAGVRIYVDHVTGNLYESNKSKK